MFEALGKIIDRKRRTWDRGKIELNQKIMNAWEDQISKEFGPAMVSMAKPLLIRNQKLIVNVKSAVIACEVQAKKEKIKNSINRIIDAKKTSLKEIVLKI